MLKLIWSSFSDFSYLCQKNTEIGQLMIFLGPFWIGASDTYGDNVIRYQGEGGAIIPDDSDLWLQDEPNHPRGNRVLMISNGKSKIHSCTDTFPFVCEIYQ